MITLADGNKIEPFAADFLCEVRHLEQRNAVAAVDQFAPERTERVDVPGDWWADDPEVHAEATLYIKLLEDRACGLPSG